MLVISFAAFAKVLFRVAPQGSFRVYPLPSDPNTPAPPKILKNLPPSAPVECLIRLYVIRVRQVLFVCQFQRWHPNSVQLK